MTFKEKSKLMRRAWSAFRAQLPDKTARCKGCIWRNQNCDRVACLLPRCARDENLKQLVQKRRSK